MATFDPAAFELQKSVGRWELLLKPLVKKAILIEILGILGDAKTEQDIRDLEENISYEFLGREYTFKDKNALIQSVQQGPRRFSPATSSEFNKRVKKLTYKDLVSLFIEEKLEPDESAKDLRLFIGSYKNFLESSGASLGLKQSFKPYYQLVSGIPSSITYTPIGITNPPAPLESLGAPLFTEFLTPFTSSDGRGTPTYEIRRNPSDFINYLLKIVNSNIGTNSYLQDLRIRYYKDVLDELSANLVAEESARDLTKALNPDTAVVESVVKELLPQDPPSLTPFDFQCFVLENIGALVDLRQQRGKYSPDYKNIIRVNSGDPATVINVIQHGTNPEGVEQFLNICPEVYGMLTPFLKVSRMEYDGLGNIKIENDEPVEKELKIPNFLTQEDVSGILSGDVGRAPGAGIKSFSWSLDGVQPAEVDNNITATLVMYFQSINDFFHGARSAGQDEPNFLDLIINAERVKNMRKKGTCPDTKPDNSQELLGKNITRKASGNDFRIKVCAGWSVPNNLEAVMKNTSEVKIKALKAALQNSRVSFFLQQTRHQINFNEDGSVELTVNYQAALAGLLTGKTANILAPSSAIGSSPYLSESKMRTSKIRRNEKTICEVGKGEQTEGDKKRLKELAEENKLLRKQDKLVRYKKLLKNLFGRFEPGNCAAVSPRIYSLSVNPKELLLTPFKDLSVEGRQRRVKRRQKDGFLKFTTSVGQQSFLLDNVAKAALDPAETNAADGYSEEETARLEDILTDKEINIPFFFLGDLFDSILEQIKENNKGEALNFKFFISDVDMIDPLQAFKLDNLEDLLDAGLNLADASFLNELKKSQPKLFPDGVGVTRLMNIGDIPISVDAFQLWFKNNVIKKDRDKYYFLYFVKDICKDLITKALDSKCFGDELDFKQRFDAVPLTLATKDENGGETLRPGLEYTALQLAEAKTNLKCETDSREASLGIILYSTDAKPRNLIANYDLDFKQGIYHHFIGSSCGLVKKINFQREDQAFLRETKIQKKGALGAEQLRELYSANLDLVGNNLYKNGMYIYINPSLIDADTPFLDYLGLHGYYFVTSVKSTVTPSGFDTQISALHQGIEFRNQKLLSATSTYRKSGVEILRPDLPDGSQKEATSISGGGEMLPASVGLGDIHGP
mgnify:CR=1 FL=1|tara:strand:+ start:4800 stop:8210 length:3411 start_codon:yes stop_codon:yes gene_type:complete